MIGIIKTTRTIGCSFALGCSIWETPYQNLFITDYDINNDVSLKPKDLFILFIPGFSYRTITGEIMRDKEYINREMKDFNLNKN